MRFLLVFTTIMMFSFSDCQKPKPTSDSTPPTLKWKVLNKNTNQFVIFDEATKSTEAVGNATVPAKIGDSYRVTLIANDDEGVHEISVTGSSEWGCSTGNVGQSHGPSLETTDTQPLEPNSEGKVLTSIFLLREVEIGPFPCQAGWNFDGGSKSVIGTAKNYFNGVTKATLVFKVSK